jgi:Arc/MetJ-type ribon-helix-helix transcriptional regulator
MSSFPAMPISVNRAVLTVRLPPALRSAIEGWAKQQDDKPSRSEAIRRLLEFALAIKAKSRN